MGIFHVFWIVLMVRNRATHHRKSFLASGGGPWMGRMKTNDAEWQNGRDSEEHYCKSKLKKMSYSFKVIQNHYKYSVILNLTLSPLQKKCVSSPD